MPEQRSRSITTKTIIGALFSFSVRARAFVVVVNYVKERFLDFHIHLQNQHFIRLGFRILGDFFPHTHTGGAPIRKNDMQLAASRSTIARSTSFKHLSSARFKKTISDVSFLAKKKKTRRNNARCYSRQQHGRVVSAVFGNPEEEEEEGQQQQQQRTTTMISLRELLVDCVECAHRGCREIRRVRAAANLSGSSLSVTSKIEGDARSALTEADVKAQAMVIGSLRKAYGTKLNVVGEEDGNEDATMDSERCESLRKDVSFRECVEAAVQKAALSDAGFREGEDAVAIEDVCVFVDPVDGTREFVEGRLENCQCLIGISVGGRAVAGAIGLPFPKGSEGFEVDKDDEEKSAILFGLCGMGGADDPESDKGVVGVFNEHLMANGYLSTNEMIGNKRFAITTGDSKNVLLKASVDAVSEAAKENKTYLQDIDRPLVGGAGSKIVNVAFGKADVALMHPTCLWDSCAPEAVLKAAGGYVSDFFGAPLCHSKDARTVENNLGIIASMPRENTPTRAEMCAKLRESEALRVLFGKEAGFSDEKCARSDIQKAQAFDIARALDGAPLTVDYLGDEIRASLSKKSAYSDDENENGGKSDIPQNALVSYSVNEDTAVRGLMSDAVRVHLDWKDTSTMPKSLFYKRVDMQSLAHVRLKKTTAPMKIGRDVQSFYVESAFLSSNAARALHSAGVGVPRCYASAFQLNKNSSVDSKFALCLEDFSPEDGWYQEKSLNLEQAKSAVIALARMHAFFLPDANYLKESEGHIRELENAVWRSGTYWQPSMQTMDEQVANLPQRWKTYLKSFEKNIAEHVPKTNDLETVGERLQKVAVAIGNEAFPFDVDDITSVPERLRKQRTIAHGDPKAGNIFLKESSASSSSSSYDCGLIDFQWSGFGLPGTDLGHFICASITEEALFDDGQTLIDVYYENFCAFATEFGCGPNVSESVLTKDELKRQVDVSILDTMRCIFGYQWHRAKANPQMLERNKNSIGRNSYNKNIFNAMWVMRRCDELLRSNSFP